MKRTKLLIAWLLGVFSTPFLSFADTLSLKNAYVIDGVNELEPSGLAVCDGKLLFVSDKHDHVIFRLQFDGKLARVTTHKVIKDAPPPPKQSFPLSMSIKRYIGELIGPAGGNDWEGLACNKHGDLFLASEYHFSVLKIGKDDTYEWLVDDLYNIGTRKGLFKVHNAFLEGITVGDDHIYLAAERQPRAIITFTPSSEIKIHLESHQKPVNNISPDFTGLEFFNGNLYVLDRNHYEVCRRNPPDFSATLCFSFKAQALSQEWGYDTGIYGLAEGVALDGDDMWLIVDNNRDPRLADADDRRALLMQFKNPY